MTQDEFLTLLRKQAGAPEADSLAEKTLLTAWKMAQVGDQESIKNATNILGFATVDPVVKNLVLQSFNQVAPTVADQSTSLDINENENSSPVEDIVAEEAEPQTITLDEVSTSEINQQIEPLSSPEPEVQSIDPVQTILTQSAMTTPVTASQSAAVTEDLVSKVLSDVQNRKPSRNEEFEQIIAKTKQEEEKREVELEQIPAVIHTYDTTYEEESEAKYHSAEEQLKAEKAEPFFARCQEYLKKAYSNGSSSIIVSAENQLKSLRERFPEYEKIYPERITAIEALKTNSAARELESLSVSGVTVKKGMTITSSHVYKVSKITEQGASVLVYFTDETMRNYRMTARELEEGLETAGIDADVFFDKYRVN